MPRWISLGFQDRGSLRIVELVLLHDYVIVVILRILILIIFIIIKILSSSFFYKSLSEGTFIETIWSVIPSLVLIVLVLPSMKVLYIVEDVKSPYFTFKVMAHQWYWTYLNPLFGNLYYFLKGETYSQNIYDSNIIVDKGTIRLLDTRSDLIIPEGLPFRVIISSVDVIHSFSVPGLGLKVDAIPGRINQLYCLPVRVGFYYGQCSEICGSNHSFMPIGVQVINLKDYDFLNFYNSLEINS